jgi:oligopeptide/dipeptide ABC transporter ATP-binding protein
VSEQKPAISVRDLHVQFERSRLTEHGDAVKAVDGVSFDVARGEVFCIAGESGCGKTTLAKTLMGLVLQTSGQIEIDGIEVGSLSKTGLKAFRRRAQMIFQDPMGSLNPRQTVYEVVAEPLRIHGVEGNERALVAEALQRAGLRPPERFFLSYPHELSGGQRQRAVIAAALALDPDVVVADEPVSMLDASVRGEILRLLADLKERLNLTLVIITHDLGFAWALSDRVAVMYLGKIVELGPAEDVLTDPLHPYTRSLLASSPKLGDRSVKQLLSGEPPDASRIPPGCRFHPRCPALRSGEADAVEHECRSVIPELLEIKPRHYAACHLVSSQAGIGPVEPHSLMGSDQPTVG